MLYESVSLPDNVTQITLDGRLDITGTQAVEQKMSFATTVKAGKFIVDLSKVSFLASIGIRMLLTCARGQANRGGKFVLAAPQPMVRKVLETAGIDQLVQISDDIAAAQAAVAG